MSPDGRVRVTLGRTAGNALRWRVTLAGRLLLGWSELRIDAPVGALQVGGGRRRVLTCGRGGRPWAREMVFPLRLRGRSAGAALVLRCSDGGAAFALSGTAAGVRFGFRVPRGSRGYVAGERHEWVLREPSGSVTTPLTLVQGHGRGACLMCRPGTDTEAAPVLTHRTGALEAPAGPDDWWLLLAADRPADLPGHADLLAATLHPLPSPPRSRRRVIAASPAGPDGPCGPHDAGRHNCTLPFTRHPEWPVPLQAAVRLDGTTDAHRRALPVVMGCAISADAAVPADADAGGEALPERWDETWFLRGEIGEYVVVARRSGRCWYMAGLTGRGRTLTLRLDFLDAGAVYAGVLREDAETAADPHRTRSERLTAGHKPVVTLLPSGGFLLRLAPVPLS